MGAEMGNFYSTKQTPQWDSFNPQVSLIRFCGYSNKQNI